MKKSIYLLGLLTILLFSCQEDPEPQCDNLEQGVLKNLAGLDGCGWVIQLNDNTMLEPINLGDFDVELEENKTVCVKYRERNDMASVCMVGKIIELEILED